MTSEPAALHIGCLQLDSSRGSCKIENLQHVDELLEAEAARLGLMPADSAPPATAADTAPAVPRGHLDILLLPELAFSPHSMDAHTAWTWAEGLQHPERSPTLQQLRNWARRWACYVGCTLLEAHPDGHFYNTFVMASPGGDLLSHAAGSGRHNGCSIIRKSRAASLEAFVFRDGQGGCGGEPAGHILELDLRPLLDKRSSSSSDSSSGYVGGGLGGRGGCSSGHSGTARSSLRVGVAICYENMLYRVLAALAASDPPIDLLLSPLCAMAPQADHPTFGWSPAKTMWFEENVASLPSAHAAALDTYVAYCNHCGPYVSSLPCLLPLPAPVAPRPPPMRSSYIGRSGIFAPGGATLAQAGKAEEVLLLAELRLRPCSSTSDGNHSHCQTSCKHGIHSSSSSSIKLPYRRQFGDQVAEDAPWEMRYGFPFVEALGKLSYWLDERRAVMARAIAAEGVWRGGQAAAEPAAGAAGADASRSVGAGSSGGVWGSGRVALLAASAAVVVVAGVAVACTRSR